MLGMRLEGDPAEAAAFLDLLATVGVEVARGTVKHRGGFAHAYSTVRMPWYTPDPATPRPIRVPAAIERPALPAGRRRSLPPVRRGTR